MAVDNDEFDVEIEGAVFDIEDEDLEVSQRINLSTAERERDKEDDGGGTGTDTRQALLQEHSLPVLDDKKSGMSTETRSANPQRDQEIIQDNFDPFMDDGCDDLLTQIDENQLRKFAGGEEICKPSNGDSNISDRFKKPFNVSEISPLKRSSDDETSSFFSSQDSSKDNPPLKRRFPGPAGLLPHLQREDLKHINMAPHPLYEKVSKLVSQNSENSSNRARKRSMQLSTGKARGNELLLSKAPWKSLIKTLNLNIKDDNDLLNILNIQWLRLKAKRFPAEMKIPFLAVVVQGELEVTSSKTNFRYKNPSVKLMDPSGTIVAALNPNFVEAYGDKIVPGTALALRNCGFLRLKNNIILTVAKKNLLCLATIKEIMEEEHNDQVNGGTEIKAQDEVSVIQNGPFPMNKIREEYQEISNKLSSAKDSLQDQSELPGQIHAVPPAISNPTSLFSIVSSTRAPESRNKPFTPPQLIPGKSCVTAATGSSHQFQKKVEEVVNFSADASSGFDDDDDEELLQALEYADFVIDEDSM